MKLTLEEKLRLVKLHIFDGVPIREIHEKHGLDRSTLKYYCALYRKWGDEPFAKPAKRKYTREILAYNLSEHPDYRQIDKMFNELEKKHGNKIKGAILHSDMGWQYQMDKHQDKVKELEILQSMSRKGNCLDNSPTENFFGRMKEEMLYDKEYLYKDMDSLIKAIVKYIEYYNEERIVNKFHMSPVMYKNKLLENQML